MSALILILILIRREINGDDGVCKHPPSHNLILELLFLFKHGPVLVWFDVTVSSQTGFFSQHL